MTSTTDVRVLPTKALRLDSAIVQVCVGGASENTESFYDETIVTSEPEPCASTQKTFFIHEAIISPRSGFFSRALNGSWQESDARLIKLPEDDPAIFALYLNLLYCGLIPTKDTTAETTNDEYGRLIRLYVLCEKFQDLEAKNTVMTAIFMKSNETLSNGLRYFPGVSDITYLYNRTPAGCLARNLLVDLYAQNGSEEWMMEEVATEFSNEFLFDLTIVLFKRPLLKGSDETKLRELETYLEDIKTEHLDAQDADAEEADAEEATTTDAIQEA